MLAPRTLPQLAKTSVASNEEPPAVSLRDVFFCHEKRCVLRKLSFEIRKGSVVCLLGPSGCGKTTVLRLIAGLERNNGGVIRLNGEEVSSRARFVAPESRCSVGMVFQDFALFPHLTVKENLSIAFRGGHANGGRANGGHANGGHANGDHATERDEIARVLEMVELEGFAECYPQRLSGGQQQRVALARALVAHPQLLLLDEPFANLDVRLRDRIRDRTLHSIQSAGCSVLLVTHDAEEGMYMSDRLLVMDEEGELVQHGAPHEIYASPCNAYVASLLSEVNRFSVAVKDGQAITPFGSFRVEFAGKRAEVVVRPQSLRLTPLRARVKVGLDSCIGVVEAARMIRGNSLVHLSSWLKGADGEQNGEEVHLHARIGGCVLPKIGSKVVLSVERNEVLLFDRDRVIR